MIVKIKDFVTFASDIQVELKQRPLEELTAHHNDVTILKELNVVSTVAELVYEHANFINQKYCYAFKPL